MMQLPPINMLSSTAALCTSARASNLHKQISTKSNLMESVLCNYCSTKVQQFIGCPKKLKHVIYAYSMLELSIVCCM